MFKWEWFDATIGKSCSCIAVNGEGKGASPAPAHLCRATTATFGSSWWQDLQRVDRTKRVWSPRAVGHLFNPRMNELDLGQCNRQLFVLSAASMPQSNTSFCISTPMHECTSLPRATCAAMSPEPQPTSKNTSIRLTSS